MSISFTVDTSKRITSACSRLEESCKLIGKIYYNYFPVFLKEEEDLVDKVLATGKPEVINNFFFFNGEIIESAVVDIIPRTTPKTSSKEIEIRLHFPARANKNPTENFINNINSLASRLAHGVRNPLNAIKGAVVYLQSRYSKENEIQEFGGIILNEVDALDDFVAGLIGSTPHFLEPCKIELAPILKRLEKLALFKSSGLGISCEFNVPGLPSVCGDPSHLEYALQNLLNYFVELLGNGDHLQFTGSTFHKSNRLWIRLGISSNYNCEAITYPDDDLSEGNSEFCLFLAREIIQKQGGSLEICKSDYGLSVNVDLPAAEKGCPDV